MDYDVAIIGAGMSGLAAGIRLAHFGMRVCLLERHHTCGGLNSYYTRKDRAYDVGLHALTNYAPAERRAGPLARMLRQLRLDRSEFDLCPQHWSEIQFPGCTLRFSNDPDLLATEVRARFPGQAAGFDKLVQVMDACPYADPEAPTGSARQFLRDHLSDPILIEMLLCPMLYYGSAREHDMELAHFITTFKSIFREGFARPRAGIRPVIRALERRFRESGGELRTRAGIARLNAQGDRVVGLTLDSGEHLTADLVISSAGYHETMRLCDPTPPTPPSLPVGRVSFVEAVLTLDTAPAALGLDPTIIFFNDAPEFSFARPPGLVDERSGVVCCPNNFERHEDMPEGVVRVTALANSEAWDALDPKEYRSAKRDCCDRLIRRLEAWAPNIRAHVLDVDFFTPRTIRKFTGHLNGAVYGMPNKLREARTHLENLLICGTDQGLQGIIGATLGGIMVANDHVLARL